MICHLEKQLFFNKKNTKVAFFDKGFLAKVKKIEKILKYEIIEILLLHYLYFLKLTLVCVYIRKER